MDSDDDRALLEAFRSSDDPDAFRRVFDRYHRRLIGYFLDRGTDLEEARDLSQDTLLRVYRSRRRIRENLPLDAWVFLVARNVFRNRLRDREAAKRRGTELTMEDETTARRAEVQMSGNPTTTAEPESHALARELVETLVREVAELPHRMRQAFLLRYRQEREIPEIAALMETAESTVKVQLHNARKRLNEALADRFGDLPW